MTKQKYIQIEILISPSRVQQPIFGYSNLGYLCTLFSSGFFKLSKAALIFMPESISFSCLVEVYFPWTPFYHEPIHAVSFVFQLHATSIY